MSNRSNFRKAAEQAATQRSTFMRASGHLIKTIQTLSKDTDDLNRLEQHMGFAFRDFLREMDYPLAAKNFEALLKEKSNGKFLRDDKSVNWYHEFIPILMMINLVRAGKKHNGIDWESLEPYGGLEVAICTHLRHDSIEDHTSKQKLRNELARMRQEIKQLDPHYDLEQAEKKCHMIVSNTDLMSQKRDPKTGMKEDVKTYTFRLTTSPDANPIVFLSKQADIIHNFATLLCAPKFTAERRQKRCDEREDMYGPRHSFLDTAIRTWPDFAGAIRTYDAMMGFMLYPHLRYIESVDLNHKTPTNYPVGIDRYLNKALSMPLPEIVDPIHIFMKRMIDSVKPQEDPAKFRRLRNFMQNVMLPSLTRKIHHFPYLLTHNKSMSLRPPEPAVAFT